MVVEHGDGGSHVIGGGEAPAGQLHVQAPDGEGGDLLARQVVEEVPRVVGIGLAEEPEGGPGMLREIGADPHGPGQGVLADGNPERLRLGGDVQQPGDAEHGAGELAAPFRE